MGIIVYFLLLMIEIEILRYLKDPNPKVYGN